MKNIVARGQPIPVQQVSELRDSSALLNDPGQLRRQFHDDGYVYLKNFFERSEIMAAREEIFTRLAEVGEIAEPVIEGIYTGTSQRKELITDLGRFWRSISETWALRRLSHGMPLHDLMGHLLNEPARAQDYIFLRPANPGKATHIHCDYPFFTRTTETVATAWIALGDIPTELGPLYILEGSHRFQDVVDSHRGFDISHDTSRKAAFDETPLELMQQRNIRLLTTDFEAGDIVVFGMFLLHGALDNVSPENRVRLSCDVRYQAAAADTDTRYFGTRPTGTTGIGYGELVGAKPLTENWHIR
jgi:ectoine hydroxylase-related dioxygenase (phytanoyl-CoA dioxygenase family)